MKPVFKEGRYHSLRPSLDFRNLSQTHIAKSLEPTGIQTRESISYFNIDSTTFENKEDLKRSHLIAKYTVTPHKIVA